MSYRSHEDCCLTEPSFEQLLKGLATEVRSLNSKVENLGFLDLRGLLQDLTIKTQELSYTAEMYAGIR